MVDFEGQKLADALCFYVMSATSVVSFLAGWLSADFGLMMKARSRRTRATTLDARRALRAAAVPRMHPWSQSLNTSGSLAPYDNAWGACMRTLERTNNSKNERRRAQLFGAGTLLTAALCIPDWPFYNRHPVQWLPSAAAAAASAAAASASGSASPGGGAGSSRSPAKKK